jgi:hypothetical protein
MTALLLPLAAALAWLWLFWLLFKVVMADYRAWLAGRLAGVPLWLSLPTLAIGWLVDWLTNWTLAAAVFGEWPRRPLELVTHRLTRYLLLPDAACDVSQRDWLRRHRARLVCTRLLDPYDPNPKGHCTTEPMPATPTTQGDTNNG